MGSQYTAHHRIQQTDNTTPRQKCNKTNTISNPKQTICLMENTYKNTENNLHINNAPLKKNMGLNTCLIKPHSPTIPPIKAYMTNAEENISILENTVNNDHITSTGPPIGEIKDNTKFNLFIENKHTISQKSAKYAINDCPIARTYKEDNGHSPLNSQRDTGINNSINTSIVTSVKRACMTKCQINSQSQNIARLDTAANDHSIIPYFSDSQVTEFVRKIMNENPETI